MEAIANALFILPKSYENLGLKEFQWPLVRLISLITVNTANKVYKKTIKQKNCTCNKRNKGKCNSYRVKTRMEKK